MKAIIVAGIGFGDEGKGSIVDSLVHKTNAKWVVRYNGGSQAAHHVTTQEGRIHCFSQFGSGTLAGASTFLSRFMMIEPLGFEKEARHLIYLGVHSPFTSVVIDQAAPVITPYHRALNRVKELMRGSSKHGSCGQGVGECASDLVSFPELTLRAGDLHDGKKTFFKLEAIRELKLSQARLLNFSESSEEFHPLLDEKLSAYYAGLFRDFALKVRIVHGDFIDLLSGPVIFEGAQGVLLDEWRGFHPYTTWSTTTFENAYSLLREMKASGDVTKIGVTRGYMTRHGVGPMPTEDVELYHKVLDRENNHYNAWQGIFRVGHLDGQLLRYSIKVCGGLDSIALTCGDKIDALPQWRLNLAYDTDVVPAEIEKQCFSRASHILVGRYGDLERQQDLGLALNYCKPIYTYGKGMPELIDVLEGALDTPIGITSYGPTHLDKQFLLTPALSRN